MTSRRPLRLGALLRLPHRRDQALHPQLRLCLLLAPIAAAGQRSRRSDNEDLKDQVYHFEERELQEAIKTRMRGAGDAQAADEHAAPDQEEEPPMTSTQHDLTMQLINLSQKCWLGPTFLNKQTTLQAARTFLQRARDSAGVDDADQMKAAAQASRAKRAGNPFPDPRPGLAGANRPPATKKTGEISAARLRKWLDSEAVRSKLNVEQHEFSGQGRRGAAADPLVEHGRSFFWGGAVQGVTELHERLRCKDGWWNEARRASVCVEFSL